MRKRTAVVIRHNGSSRTTEHRTWRDARRVLENFLGQQPSWSTIPGEPRRFWFADKKSRKPGGTIEIRPVS